MGVDWSTLEDDARSTDLSARAGAVIRGQAELERFMGASGWSRQDGESLYQLLIRARKQRNIDWISDDIGWAGSSVPAIRRPTARPSHGINTTPEPPLQPRT